MWKCSICGFKNNNSSLKCHGIDCVGIKQGDSIITESKPVVKQKKIKRIYDFCPACQRDMFFTPTTWKGKKAWSCESKSHRPTNFSGKSKPIPEEMKIAEI